MKDQLTRLKAVAEERMVAGENAVRIAFDLATKGKVAEATQH